MRIIFYGLLCGLMFISPSMFAQGEQDSTTSGNWTISAFGEAFLSVTPDAGRGQRISDFQFNHNRLNRLALNQGMLGVAYQGKQFRMDLAAHLGTYAIDNYASEPAQLRSVYKAYVGFRLNRKKNAWLDVGVFPSYIGFEGVNAFDNATLTRSLLAENSPYFLTGVRSNFPVNQHNEISLFLLTGWQRIIPQKHNSIPSIGYQWVHTFPNNSTFYWSVWMGTDHPDSTRKWRYFNNFYWKGKQGKWAYTLGFDLGAEQKLKGAGAYHLWYAPVVITQYNITEKWRAAFRLERYADPQRIVAKSANGYAASVNSQSINIDFAPRSNMLCRIEWRRLKGTETVFHRNSSNSDRINYLTVSLAYQLNKILGPSKKIN